MREIRPHPTAYKRYLATIPAGIAMLPVYLAYIFLKGFYGYGIGFIPVVAWGIWAAIVLTRYVRAYWYCPICGKRTDFDGFTARDTKLFICTACDIRWDTNVKPSTDD